MDEEPAPDLTDPATLRDWLVARREALFRSAWRVLGCAEAAEDAAHDALVRLLVRPGDLARAASPERYLRRVAINAALDERRAEERRRR